MSCHLGGMCDATVRSRSTRTATNALPTTATIDLRSIKLDRVAVLPGRERFVHELVDHITHANTIGCRVGS